MTKLAARHSVAAALLVACICPRARAQSRADEIAEQQREKARRTQEYRPNGAEVFLDQVEHGNWVLGTPREWYLTLGSVYPGGGFAAGGGYRHYIGYDSFIDAGALFSVLGYKKAEIHAYTPNHAKSRVDFEGTVGWIDATKVAFYGLGNDSSLETAANFRLNRAYVEGATMVRPTRWLQLRLDGGFDDYLQRPGLAATPSIERLFSPLTAPQLGATPLYLRGEASALVYWLKPPGYSRTGGHYNIAYEEFNPLRGPGGTFGFLRTEVVQYVPIMRETWVVALRGRMESVLRKSDVVPYFLMPTLGSGNDLRGFSSQRFRDRHTLLLSSEFRWFPNRQGLDMALFFDAGKVAPHRSDLTLTDMHIDYGIGVRLHGPAATVLRVDFANGPEGRRVVFETGAAF